MTRVLAITLAAGLFGCQSEAPARLHVNDKLAVTVTPAWQDVTHFSVTNAQALDSLKGYARTVWILDDWQHIEKADGRFDWSTLDSQVDAAVKNGFDVGIRAQIVLCGNDDQKRFITISRVPGYIRGGMLSNDFAAKAERFYSTLAARYRGKARYIAVGNSVNDYFERRPADWEAFKKAYPAIVRAIHQADPKVKVLSDLSCGDEFLTDKAKLQKYLDYFGKSNDDGFGFILYFIVKGYYGEFSNFTQARFAQVLDDLHARGGPKGMYIIETSCFSTNPLTGVDMSGVQTQYVDMLIRTVVEKDYMLGLSWWQLYDARDEPGVPWDIKASFGLFDAQGKPKPAWEAWKKLSTLRKAQP